MLTCILHPILPVSPSLSLSLTHTHTHTCTRTQEVLIYTELLETRRQYLCGLTPTWALPTLLLTASALDTDELASRWVVDGWLLIRIYDGSGPQVRKQIGHV